MSSFNVWFPIVLLVLSFVGLLLILSSPDFYANQNSKSKYPIFTIMVTVLIDWGIGCFNTFGIWQIVLLSLIVFQQIKPTAAATKKSALVYILASFFGLFVLFQCGGFDAMLNYMGYTDLLKYKI